MPNDHSAELMKSLIAKLYATVTGDDSSIKIPRNKFVSWLLPEVPFVPEDFQYCSEGLIADNAENTEGSFLKYVVVREPVI